MFHAPVDGQTPHLSARFIGDSLGQAAKPQAQAKGGSVETRDHPSFNPTAARPLSPHRPSDEMLSRTVNAMDTGPAEHGDKADFGKRGSAKTTALSPLELPAHPSLKTTIRATATSTPSSATLPTQYRITKALAPQSVTLSVSALTEASVSENAPAVSPAPSKSVVALSSAGPLPDPTQGKTGQGQKTEGSLILPASVDPANHTAPTDRRAGLETVPNQPNPPMTQPVGGTAGSPESNRKTVPLTIPISETMDPSDGPGAPGVAPSTAPEARVIAMQTPPPQPSAPPVTQQIVQAIGDLSRGPVELRMAPEELGAVRMTLTPTEQGLTLTIHADRDETAALLRRHLDQLAADFRDLGFRNLSFQLGSGGAGGSGAHVEPGNAPVGVGDTEQQIQPAQYHTVNRADDRLDLRL
ncbi:flagellar hook-length control protein FliK [Oceaniovalibus sp. ACAM 378]|uniref:flagellar hook-length control protein FliK n=1 Tax=Oceaniovalibus sp. ACAM 378 TaxID=2599923 RepID=UPI0016527B73|nr:flagellar hook-length control protein FliK [Oceaniovalibus sp. ACAM 378]